VAADGIDKVFLGRPWRPYGQSVFIDCFLDKHIRPEGWDNWRNPENEKTARFVEIGNNGPGASMEKRVAWCKNGKNKEKKEYEISRVFSSSVEKWQPEE
jgi:pectinesterase